MHSIILFCENVLKWAYTKQKKKKKKKKGIHPAGMSQPPWLIHNNKQFPQSGNSPLSLT